MKTTVIYHSADFDGLFCREIARKFIPGAELIGWDYGNNKLPFPNEGQVYVMDLSPECFQQFGTTQDVSRMTWIDHHATAIAKYGATGAHDRIAGYRIDGVAACRLAWQWFEGASLSGGKIVRPTKEAFVDRVVKEPFAVRLAGEYDIWDKRDPDAELFQHGLRTRDIDTATWGDLRYWDVILSETMEAKALVNDLLVAARYVKYSKEQENEAVIKSYGFNLDFEGLHFLACNHARFNSQLFTAGVKPEHDALLGFNWSGKEWRVSLYHAPGHEHHDLSQIAVKYKGGGHKGACGFRMATLPWLL